MVEFLLARLLRKQMDVHISPSGGLKVRGRGLLTLQHTDGDELQWLFWVLIEPVVCVEVQHTNTTFVFKREKKEAQ